MTQKYVSLTKSYLNFYTYLLIDHSTLKSDGQFKFNTLTSKFAQISLSPTSNSLDQLGLDPGRRFLKNEKCNNMSVYLIGYGIWRFCLEFIRGDHRGELVSGISPSQFWSLLMVVLGVALIFVMNYLAKRPMPIAAEEPVTAIDEEQTGETEEE